MPFSFRPLSLVVAFCLSLSFVLISLAWPMHSVGASSDDTEMVVIPGPLRAFLRMAGISQKIPSDQVVPLLARNVFMQGYTGAPGKGRQTEFLILLKRYVHQARELAALAGPNGAIQVSNCEQAAPLLHVLGYRVREACGTKETVLVTADPERAFLTIDSGFPLNDLEEALQGGKAFSYNFAPTTVPVLFRAKDWTSINHAAGDNADLIDDMLNDSLLARLYWAMSRTDPKTASALREHPGLARLIPLASVFDFYGTQICIRGGRVVVPGGTGAESEWKSLVGVSPQSPDEFIPRLLAKDRGWLGAYFDALSRVSQEQQEHFVESRRLRRFYEAFRSTDPSEDAARPSFRPAAYLLLLVARTRWESNGDPLIPGNLNVWADVLRQKSDAKVVREWGRRSGQWNNPDQLLEAMFAFSRLSASEGPLPAYLTLSEIDGRRPADKRLDPKTVFLLASKFAQLSEQYRIFSEFSDLNDASIQHFVNVTDTLSHVPNHAVRGDAMGIFQANVGLWQILSRQGQIPSAQRNDSWQRVIGPFASISTSPQLFNAARDSLAELMHAAGVRSTSQDELVALLAGPPQTNPDGERMHDEATTRIHLVLEDQHLVSLDTLLALGNALDAMAHGRGSGDGVLSLAGELREFQMPRPIFTGSERTQWAAGIFNDRHTELEMHTDLPRVIKNGASAAQLEEARGQLTPFLRDTLVGLNYAYYEPPGAQILHNNPLFVRSHDFSGDTVTGVDRPWRAPRLFGEGSPAGGGARLVGSLADLPYVLAELEQDFIAPENVQALIWRELVPGLLISATLPRWWGVSQDELHAVALYQKSGEELLHASIDDQQLRGRALGILSDRMSPQMVDRLQLALNSGDLANILPQLMPADTFYLAAEYRRRFPQETIPNLPASRELTELNLHGPQGLNWGKISQDFGVPHPILSQRYSPELLNLKPLPALSGYSSRLLAETWDSNNLYWARLADEMGYSPVTLNRLVPQLTHRMIEKIFATDQEDWPAILRAMRETGDEFRQGKAGSLSLSSAVPQR